jgi:hypothetical protein
MYNDFPEKSLSPPEPQVYDYCSLHGGEIYQYEDAWTDVYGEKVVCTQCKEEHTEEMWIKINKRNVYIRRYR